MSEQEECKRRKHKLPMKQLETEALRLHRGREVGDSQKAKDLIQP